MKVKLVCDTIDYHKFKEMLEKGGFTITDDSDYIFYDRNIQMNYITGKIDDEYEMISIHDIVYIESFSHDIILHTMEQKFSIKEKLYQLEGMLEEQGFIRVNQSTVINKSYIKRIRPSFNSKFVLIMKNGSRIDVTRSYYQKFKSIMKI